MNDKYIGHYKLIRKIGQGGMAQVYLAHDTLVNRYVAIKAQKSEHKRFIREAQYLSALNHPNILKIYDFFTINNMPFMVMEYCEGLDLGVYLKKNELTLTEKLLIFKKITLAVDYAHKNKIIHRDLKPANIMIAQDQTPYLMDFGIAKQLDNVQKSLTGSDNKIVGTLLYMSPEQVRAKKKEIDYLTDVYSLGAVLYEMITGVMYVSGVLQINILCKILNEKPIPPQKINKDIPSSLDYICLKALQKDKKHRYQSAKAFHDDIDALLNNKSAKASKLDNFWGYHSQKIIFFLVSTILLIAMCFFVFSSRGVQQQRNFTIVSTVEDWIDQGFYDKAYEELEIVKKEGLITSSKYNEYELILSAKTQSTKNFDNLITKIQKPFSSAVWLALGEYHFSEKNNIKAIEYFSKVLISEPTFEKKYARYYLGRLYYRSQEYHLALEQFLAAQSIISNRTFYDYGMLHFFIGKVYFYLAKYTEALQSLQIAQKNLQQFAPVYHYLGKSYFFLGNYQQAKKYLDKSIVLETENSTYYVWLGKVLVKQQKYSKASRIFQQARTINPLDIEALQEFIEIATQDINLIDMRYLQLISELQKWVYRPENILNIPLAQIRDKYLHHYTKYLKFKKNQTNQNSINNLVKKLSSQDEKIFYSARSGLLVLRYSENIIDVLKKHGQLQMASDILNIRQKEELYALYYMMAHASLHPRSRITKSLSIEKVEDVLVDKEENLWHRYIAAKSLILLYQFEKIEWFRQHSKDKTLQVICARVLQDFNMITTEKIKQIPVSGFSNPILRKICAGFRSFYSCDEDQLVHFLQGDAISAVLIAQSLIGKDNKLAAKILVKYTNSKYSQQIRCIAYSFLAKTMTRDSKQKQQYQKSWQNVFTNFSQESAALQITILQRSQRMRIKIPRKTIQDILYEDTHSYTKIAVINYLDSSQLYYDIIEKYYFEEDKDPIVRLYAFTKLFRRKLSKSFKIMSSVPLIESNSKFLRSYGYSIYAGSGKEVLEWLNKEENPNLQAIILKNVGMVPFPIVRRKYKSKIQRKEIAQKYFNAKNNNLRTYAYGAYSYLANEAVVDSLVLKMKENKDFYIRKGISLAINRRMMSKLMTSKAIDFLTLVNSSRIENEVPYYEKFRRRVQEHHWAQRYKKIFAQMHALEFMDANDYFREGILVKSKGHYQKASGLFEKAIQLEEKILFYLELLDTDWKHTNTVSRSIAQKLLALTREKILHPKYYQLLLKMPYSQAVEDILKQNILSLSTYPGENRIVYNLAWKNLIVYNKNNARKQQYRMYQSMLRNRK
ncbi:serine/threonine-protein kinase [Candidatus Uabimicrobium helgolandensis]